MPTIRPMSARVRWVVLGVVLLLVLGLAALYWFNANLAGVTLEESDGQRTWNVQSGGAVKLSADDVRPSDRYTCDEIGARSVDAPSPGRQIARQGVKGVISVETAEDGDVTITCERGVALPGT